MASGGDFGSSRAPQGAFGQEDEAGAWPEDAAAAAVVAAVVQAVDADRQSMVDAVGASMEATVAAYRDLPPSDRDVVRQGVQLTVDQFVDLLRQRRRLAPDEMEVIESLGSVRAAQDVALDEMLHGIRAAMSAGWAHLLELVPADADAGATTSALRHLGTEVFHYMQHTSALMAKGYAAHQRLGLAARIRARDDAVEELLSGVLGSDHEVARRAAAIGLDLTVPYGVLLFALPRPRNDATEPLRRAKDGLVARVLDALDGGVRSTPTAHAVVVAPAPSPWEWDRTQHLALETAGEEVLVLSSGPVQGARAIHACYAEAAYLVRLARHVRTPSAVVHPGDLDVYRFLDAAGPEAARALVRRALGPVLALPADHGEKLLGTLRALADAGGLLAGAAELLGVHPKTVASRLRRLEQLTGLDVDRPLDRLQLDTAALLVQLYPDG